MSCLGLYQPLELSGRGGACQNLSCRAGSFRGAVVVCVAAMLDLWLQWRVLSEVSEYTRTARLAWGWLVHYAAGDAKSPHGG